MLVIFEDRSVFQTATILVLLTGLFYVQEQPSRNSRSLSIAPDGKNDSNVGNVLGVPPDQLKQLQESVRKNDEHDVVSLTI